MKHHSIIVTTFDKKLSRSVHRKAKSIFGNLTTPLKEGVVNSYLSFAILPDGSKEGWPESDEYDEKRRHFWKFVAEQKYEDGSNSIKAVEVYFDDEGRVGIVRL